MRRSWWSPVFSFSWGLLILVGVCIGEISPYLSLFGALCWFSAGVTMVEWLGPEYLIERERKHR